MASGIKINCRALLKRMSEADQARLNDAVDNYADEPVNEAYKYALHDLIETLEGQKAEIVTLAKAKGGGTAVERAGKQLSTVEELTKELRTRLGKLFDTLPLTIVQSTSELPERPDVTLHPARTRGMYFDGKAFIVADNVDVRDVFGLALHESGVHAGMAKLLGLKLWNTVQADFQRMVANGNEAAIAARDRVPSNTREHLKTEEGIAYLVEMSPDQPLVTRIIAAIRQWIYRMTGGKLIDLNEHDLRQMAIAALRAEGRKSSDVIYAGLGDWYYSPLKKGVENATQEAMPADQWKAWLNSNAAKLGIKLDEIRWSGITDWLDLQGKAKVTKQDIAGFLDENRVEVEEMVLGGEGKASEAMRRALTGESRSEVSFTPDEWIEHSERFERTAQSWQRNGDPQQAEKYFSLAEEAARLAEGVDSDSGSTRGMPKFASYQLPGGENYRELLLRLPQRVPEYEFASIAQMQSWLADNPRAYLDGMGDLEKFKVLNKERRKHGEQPKAFQSSHFDQPNILAHIRFNERTDADGKRVLFIEELQSDWAQKGRKEGFAVPLTDEQIARKAALKGELLRLQNKGTSDAERAEYFMPGAVIGGYSGKDKVISYHPAEAGSGWSVRVIAVGPDGMPKPGERVRVHSTDPASNIREGLEHELWGLDRATQRTPSAPFVTDTKAWVALALKRMIRYAAENGFDRVAWTTGEQQAARYDLSKYVRYVEARKLANGKYAVSADTIDGDPLFTGDVTDSELADTIGKELAEKIAAQEIGAYREYSGLDLKVGGEGMKAFYDKIIPQVANDVLKKLGGGKVGEVFLSTPAHAEKRSHGWIMVEDATGKQIAGPESSQSAVEAVYQADAKGTQYGFDITPELQESALKGMPLFSIAADTPLRTRGENIPDKIEYNKSVIAQAVRDESKEMVHSAIEKIMFLSDLMDYAVRNGLSTARGFNTLLDSKSRVRSSIGEQVAALAQQGYDLKDSEVASEFIRISTRSGKWGYEPTWKKDVDIDPALATTYKTLSAEAKQVVDASFKHGEDMWKRKQFLVNKAIHDEYEALLALAEDQKEKIKLENERDTKISEIGRIMPKLDGPYAPLKRFGDYVSVVHSEAFQQALDDDNPKAVARMEADPNHNLVEFHDTIWAAKARARQLAPYFPNGSSEGMARQKLHRMLQEVPWAGIAKIKTAISDMEGKAPYKKALQNMATDLYLTMLAESSARKSEMHRKGIAGEEKDMFRSIAAQGQSDAHFIAALENNDAISRKILEMQHEAADSKDGKRHEKTRILNEILARYAQAVDFRPTPTVDFIKSLTAKWMLVLSPSYYIQNATQPFMLTAPVLTGKYGPTETWKALLKAYKDVSSFTKSMTHTLDIDSLPISTGEKTMLKNMRDQGKLDLTIMADIDKFASGEASDGVFGKVMRKIWSMPQQVEMLNRITSALATYRLSKGSEDEVGHILDNTHGNYAASNAPRFMESSGVGKLVFQFRKFQLIQLSLLARLGYNAFHGASQEEKIIARRALRWLIGQHLLMTGVMGMPIPAALWAIFAAVGSDDDEPADAERLIREWIGDEKVADLLLRGVPAFLGMDVSQRIGMSQATALLPFVDLDPSRKGYEKALVGASGPFFGGLAPQVMDGINLIGKGDYYRGIETAMPRGIKDTLKAYRQATEGVTLRNGDVVIQPEEVTIVDTMAAALGLPTIKYTERMRRQQDQIEFEQYFRERASEIKHDYTKAYKSTDTSGMAQAQKEWQDLQQAKQRNGFKTQPMSSLMKAPKEQMKRERQVMEGLEYKSSNRQFVEEEVGI